MATSYPTSLQDLDATRGTTGQPLSTPNHITHHTTEDDTTEALQAKVGIDSSAVTTTIDYKLKNSASIDPGHHHTNSSLDSLALTKLTGAGTGVLTALAVNVGSAGAPLVNGGVLGTPSSGTMTNVTGLTEAGQTLADNTTNDVSTSKHGYVPKAPNDTTKFLRGDATWAVPSARFKTGNTTHNMSTTTTTPIAHGLGVTPKFVRLSVNQLGSSSATVNNFVMSTGTYDGTTQNCLYTATDANGGSFTRTNIDTSNIIHFGVTNTGTADSSYITGVASVDATNITITWTNFNGGTTGTGNILWETFG